MTTHVELKLAGEYVYCEVVSTRPGYTTVILPSGQRREVHNTRICG